MYIIIDDEHDYMYGKDPYCHLLSRLFNYDASQNGHLRFVLEKVKRSKTEIMAYGDLPFLHEVRPSEPQTVDATFALVRYRGKGSLPGPEEGKRVHYLDQRKVRVKYLCSTGIAIDRMA